MKFPLIAVLAAKQGSDITVLCFVCQVPLWKSVGQS